jgi:outer membrane biosynthesis protein TonB
VHWRQNPRASLSSRLAFNPTPGTISKILETDQSSHVAKGRLSRFLDCHGRPCHAETDAVDAWKKQIVTRLNASKRFPLEAMGQSGTAKVAFVLDRSGKLISKETCGKFGLPSA